MIYSGEWGHTFGGYYHFSVINDFGNIWPCKPSFIAILLLKKKLLFCNIILMILYLSHQKIIMTFIMRLFFFISDLYDHWDPLTSSDYRDHCSKACMSSFRIATNIIQDHESFKLSSLLSRVITLTGVQLSRDSLAALLPDALVGHQCNGEIWNIPQSMIHTTVNIPLLTISLWQPSFYL